MKHDNHAPGGPGIAPTWCSSDKDLVMTALGTSRTWATIGHGILNEVYWPSTGQPQIRDLGFIVAKGGDWWELKRLNNYELSTEQAYILHPTIRHIGEGFQVTLEVVCDDLRDVILLRFKLEGDGHRLYALLAPRLNSRGGANTAWCEDDAFYAQGGPLFLSLRSDVGFAHRSVGYVGHSDGWQDFHRHGSMTWEYSRAEDGNVAMIGELDALEGTLALSFSASRDAARTLARSSLAEGFPSVRARVRSKWEEWGANWDPPAKLDERFRSYVELSTAVLKTCDGRLFPGAVVASLSIPWGNSRNDLGGYHLVWARDSVESAFGMIAVDDFIEARQIVAYLIATQQRDGHWSQNFYPSGTPYWTGIQLDQTSFPLLLVAKLSELGELGDLNGVGDMRSRALGFLLREGAVTPQDRWEENEGINAFTLGLIISAIVGASQQVENDDEREYLLSYADYLNRRIEDWLYVENSELATKYQVDGHYIRIASRKIFAGDHGEIKIANGGGSLPESEVVALDYMYLARLGLRDPRDPRMQNTLKVVEGELQVETPNGPCFYRYNRDGYGEHADGSPYDGTGIGRLWPLLTGERGHLAVLLGEDPLTYLNAMCNMTGPCGLLPEQVWDVKPIPKKHLYPGKPTGSAMPLLWAHAELVKLATVSITKTPIELLDSVRDRYNFARPEPSTWHWRPDMPFNELPVGIDLLVEAPEPFSLHFGFDGWQHVEDRRSVRLGWGMHGVRMRSNDLTPYQEMNLTLFYETQSRWEEEDHRVRISHNSTSKHSKNASRRNRTPAKPQATRSRTY